MDLKSFIGKNSTVKFQLLDLGSVLFVFDIKEDGYVLGYNDLRQANKYRSQFEKNTFVFIVASDEGRDILYFDEKDTLEKVNKVFVLKVSKPSEFNIFDEFQFSIIGGKNV